MIFEYKLSAPATVYMQFWFEVSFVKMAFHLTFQIVLTMIYLLKTYTKIAFVAYLPLQIIKSSKTDKFKMVFRIIQTLNFK